MLFRSGQRQIHGYNLANTALSDTLKIKKENFKAEEDIVEHMKEIIRGIRNIRSEMNVANNRKTKVNIVTESANLKAGFDPISNYVMPLMNATEIITSATKEGIAEDAVSIVVPDAVVYLPLEDLVDFAQELERLQKEEEKLTKEIARAKGMLSNERFVSKAPEAKVQEEKDKLEKYTQMLEQVKERMSGLKK